MSSSTDPTDAFEIVGDGTRVGILRTLAERQAEHPHDPHLSFSELRDRVGTRDSGQFNYHLDRLRGRFVEKEEDGYHLTYPGLQVVSSIFAGAYDSGESRGPVELDGTCPICGEALSATYDRGVLVVDCGNDHGIGNGVPPGALEGREMTDVVGLMSLINQHEMELLLDDTCPRCYGHATPRLRPSQEGEDVPDWVPSHVFVGNCERCGAGYSNLPGGLVVRHPAVVSLYYDHGIDVRGRGLLELEFLTVDPVVVSEDPLRLRVDVAREGDEVRLTMDDTGTVVDVERD